MLEKSTPPVITPHGRHDDVVHQRLDDGREGGADDDTNRHVDNVTAQSKLLEFFQHPRSSSS